MQGNLPCNNSDNGVLAWSNHISDMIADIGARQSSPIYWYSVHGANLNTPWSILTIAFMFTFRSIPDA